MHMARSESGRAPGMLDFRTLPGRAIGAVIEMEALEQMLRLFSGVVLLVGLVEALAEMYDTKEMHYAVGTVICWVFFVAFVPLFLATWRCHTAPELLLMRYQIIIAIFLTFCRGDRIFFFLHPKEAYSYSVKVRLKSIYVSMYVLVALLSLVLQQTPRRYLQFATCSTSVEAVVRLGLVIFGPSLGEPDRLIPIVVAVSVLSLTVGMHVAVLFALYRAQRVRSEKSRTVNLVQALMPREEARPDWVLVVSVDRYSGFRSQENIGIRPLLFQCECCVEDRSFEPDLAQDGVTESMSALRPTGSNMNDSIETTASTLLNQQKSCLKYSGNVRTTTTRKVMVTEGEEFIFVVPSLLPPQGGSNGCLPDSVAEEHADGFGTAQITSRARSAPLLQSRVSEWTSYAVAPRRAVKLKWRVWCEMPEDASKRHGRDRARGSHSRRSSADSVVEDADLHHTEDGSPVARGRCRSRTLEKLQFAIDTPDDLDDTHDPELSCPSRGRARSQAIDDCQAPPPECLPVHRGDEKELPNLSLSFPSRARGTVLSVDSSDSAYARRRSSMQNYASVVASTSACSFAIAPEALPGTSSSSGRRSTFRRSQRKSSRQLHGTSFKDVTRIDCQGATSTNFSDCSRFASGFMRRGAPLEFPLFEVDGCDGPEALYAPDGGSVRVPLIASGGDDASPQASHLEGDEAWLEFSVLAISVSQQNVSSTGRGPMVVPTAAARLRQQRRPKLLTFGKNVQMSTFQVESPANRSQASEASFLCDEVEEHEDSDGDEDVVSTYLSTFLAPERREQLSAPTIVVECGAVGRRSVEEKGVELADVKK